MKYAIRETQDTNDNDLRRQERRKAKKSRLAKCKETRIRPSTQKGTPSRRRISRPTALRSSFAPPRPEVGSDCKID